MQITSTNVKSIPRTVGPEDKAVIDVKIPHKACAGISTSDTLGAIQHYCGIRSCTKTVCICTAPYYLLLQLHIGMHIIYMY